MRVKYKMKLDDYYLKLEEKGLNEYGQEVPDPTPMAPPVGYKKQPSMFDIVRDAVRSEQLRLYAQIQELESFEEADDFDVEDDIDPASPHEMSDLEPISVLRARLAAAEKAAGDASRVAESPAASGTRKDSSEAPQEPPPSTTVGGGPEGA